MSPRALASDERQVIWDVLHSARFQDRSPTEVYATLLDEGTYLASERTYYRLLAADGETTERRNQLAHPAYRKPELLAERPNEVWSWDITRLLGPTKWTYYYLYVIVDIFSRMVVGWMVAHQELASLAERLIADTRRLGFREVVDPAHQSDIITSFFYPDTPSFEFARFYRGLRDRNVVIYPGKLLGEDYFRIGTAGRLYPEGMDLLVDAMDEVLRARLTV